MLCLWDDDVTRYELFRDWLSIKWCNALTIGTAMLIFWGPILLIAFVVYIMLGWLPDW